jgi:hypothetical protein
MSTDGSGCALGVSGQTLSAWRDGALPDVEARRIAGHVAACHACQRRLARFERIASALRRQPAPNLGARTWAGIQAHLAAKKRRPVSGRHAAAFSGLGAAAAAAVVALLLASVLSHRPGGSTGLVGGGGPATATPAPPPACAGFLAGYHTQLPNPDYTSTNVYADIPLPPESRIVPDDASGGVRGYDICGPGTVASVASFMRARLTALGWTPAGDGVWTKAGHTLTVRVTAATDWTISWRDPDLHF